MGSLAVPTARLWRRSVLSCFVGPWTRPKTTAAAASTTIVCANRLCARSLRARLAVARAQVAIAAISRLFLLGIVRLDFLLLG
ncbi:hypothetical protein PF005_g31312 [Phytophthora fragariae]|uniref:Uncharacterized protein n=1 Tax=Phytophthora fragariae TaxID=53985 RepID=A0A6A4B246_9STRA|nr:hypothetical protein PF009_g31430 [Phytophthora fragariae]KAE8959063.1 hypothetical protein PF011_g30549 [Phytophthora fragariae]KAE9057051.1 hypothetical protein PF010_g31524 [Phytophthora fragariae]KAE9062393.1 hypothetical protein PF006_g31176 [Phytophthora fragariae]KAE9161277.1 hypothetical protein PF005_g31312 [Phytophthora fragariae]